MRLVATSVLFVCPSRYSLGELYNAMRIAGRLAAELGVVPVFAVPSRHAGYAASAGWSVRPFPAHRADNRTWLLKTIADVAPSLVVLADHENLAVERTSIDHETVYGSGVPVVVLDSLQFAPGPRTVRYAVSQIEGSERLHRWLPPEVTIPAVPDDVPVVTPVPVASVASAINPVRIYEPRSVTRRVSPGVRERLGVPAGHRLVVSAQSAWAAVAFEQLSQGRGGNRYDLVRTRRLARGLSDSDVPAHLVVVGGSGETDLDGVHVQASPRLDRDEFTDLLASADLYVTDNLISGAMAQAAVLGTPVLALLSSRPRNPSGSDPLDDLLDERYPGWDFPYLVNPFGWHEELATVQRDNPYLSAVPRAEFFDRADLASNLARQLGDDPDRDATTALADLLPRVPPPAGVFATLADAIGP